jgi:hypothetical protein
MASSLTLTLDVITSIVFILIFGYAAYWAYRIRNALFVRLYRNQALGIFLIAFAYTSIFVFFPAFALTSALPFFLAWQISILAGNLTLFYVIDSSILVARRSDPLLRNTFNWRKARVPIWTIYIVLEILVQIGIFNGVFYNINLPEVAGLIILPAPLVLLVVVGGIFLPVSAKRSKDPTIRRQLEWFGLFVLLSYTGLIITDLIPGGPSFQTVFIGDPFFIASGYFIYRSARSLVPLNKITLEVETK